MAVSCARGGHGRRGVSRSRPSSPSSRSRCSPGMRSGFRSREASVSLSSMRATSCSLEGFLSLDFESSLIRLVADSDAETALRWLYANIHLPVLFAFIAAVRLLAPDRYPLLRTTFVASFIPAALVIGLYPLAPPRWMPELGARPPSCPVRARRVDRDALPQRDRRGRQPALRVRAVPRRRVDLALPPLAPCLGDARVPRARLRCRRREPETTTSSTASSGR